MGEFDMIPITIKTPYQMSPVESGASLMLWSAKHSVPLNKPLPVSKRAHKPYSIVELAKDRYEDERETIDDICFGDFDER